jgi:Ca2+-binding EF-hand superfamily protein
MVRTIGLAMLAMLLFSGVAAARNARSRSAFCAARFVEILDTNGDGTVSVAEVFAEHARLFAAADLNRDGILSVDEFRRRGRLFQSLGTATLFDMLDTNGDQTLSPEEINQPSQRWFSRYDLNGDGAMAAGELSQGGQAGGSNRRR